MSEIIQLTDTARLVVDVDEGTPNPRKDWAMQTGFVKIEGRGDSRLIDVEPVHEPPIPIRDAHERLADRSYGYRNRYGLEGNVERWARIFHDRVIEYDSAHGGYWFVHMDENFSADATGQRELIADEQKVYAQWAESAVYVVNLERAEQYVRYTGEPAAAELDWEFTTQRWEHVASLGDCYLNDDYTAQQVAREHFDLTDEETAALGLPELTIQSVGILTKDGYTALPDEEES